MHKTINKDALRASLSKVGWTQAQLAHQIGVSSQSVTNWLKNEGFPRPATLLKLAKTLKINFNQALKIKELVY